MPTPFSQPPFYKKKYLSGSLSNRHYTVVGIFERRKESDKMLEHLIPQFFRGLSTFGSGKVLCSTL